MSNSRRGNISYLRSIIGAKLSVAYKLITVGIWNFSSAPVREQSNASFFVISLQEQFNAHLREKMNLNYVLAPP